MLLFGFNRDCFHDLLSHIMVDKVALESNEKDLIWKSDKTIESFILANIKQQFVV